MPGCGLYHGSNLRNFTTAPGRGYGAGYSDARLGLYRPASPAAALLGYDAGHCAGRIDAGIPAHKLRNPAKK